MEPSKNIKLQDDFAKPSALTPSKRSRADVDTTMPTALQKMSTREVFHDETDPAGSDAHGNRSDAASWAGGDLETGQSIGTGPRPPDTIKTSRFKLRKDMPYVGEVPDNELDPRTFPSMGLLLLEDWNPSDERKNTDAVPKTFLLEDFSFLKNQTLAFKVTDHLGMFNICIPTMKRTSMLM